MVKWLKSCDCDQHGLNLIPTCTIQLCPWKTHFTALSPACWSLQAVLNFSHTSIILKNQNKKFQAESNILASSEASWGNCLAYVLVPPSLSHESRG